MDSVQQKELARVFDIQRESRWVAKNSTADERIGKLKRLRAAVVQNADAATAALRADLRRVDPTPMAQEVIGVLSNIDHAIEHLAEWMEPVPYVPTEAYADTAQAVRYEARGVVLLFGPWNFPFQLVFEPLVPIIAAGNTAIVKPNEMSPATSELVARIIREVFDEAEVAVFEGGVDLANDLLELPFDHIFFTGSPKVASTVMAAAAKHLASVTLELGGKCPAIVDGTTDLATAAEFVAMGKHYNSGQICLSPDHLFVHEDVKDEFLGHYLKWIEDNLYVGGRLNTEVFGRIVDSRNFARVTGYIQDAVARGAKLVGTGAAEEDDLTVHPAVLLDVPKDSAIMEEEIFGPVLPVFPYSDPQEVVDQVRRGGKPLAMYIHSSNDTLIDKLIMETSSGGVTVNGWASHFAEHHLPFGGVGSSGLGAYHSVHGFRELSHARPVVVHPAA